MQKIYPADFDHPQLLRLCASKLKENPPQIHTSVGMLRGWEKYTNIMWNTYICANPERAATPTPDDKMGLRAAALGEILCACSALTPGRLAPTNQPSEAKRRGVERPTASTPNNNKYRERAFTCPTSPRGAITRSGSPSSQPAFFEST